MRLTNALPLLLPITLLNLAIAATPEATLRVQQSSSGGTYAVLGTVEAVRQASLQAQVAGRITEVLVRSGESVRANAPLLRIDASAADAASAASEAQAAGAAAQLREARAAFARAQTLRASDYISEAALQRAEAQLRSAEAQANSATAQSRGANTFNAWHVLRAPYDATVTAVNVTPGDQAQPGRTLVTLYAPGPQRIVAHIPEEVARRLQTNVALQLQLASSNSALRSLPLKDWQRIAAVDLQSRTVTIRAELPAGLGLEPGNMLRLLLPTTDNPAQMLIPASAVVRRSEIAGVYVLDSSGVPHLRQLRLGPVVDGQVAVLAGLSDGELISTDPQAMMRRQDKP